METVYCSVPDCNREATKAANISINNAPKKILAVCAMHALAADEDKKDKAEPNIVMKNWKCQEIVKRPMHVAAIMEMPNGKEFHVVCPPGTTTQEARALADFLIAASNSDFIEPGWAYEITGAHVFTIGGFKVDAFLCESGNLGFTVEKYPATDPLNNPSVDVFFNKDNVRKFSGS